jgi:hypothetical protein
MYHTEPCFTGFRGALRDSNTQVPDVQQPHANLDLDDQSSPFASLFATSTLWYQAKWRLAGGWRNAQSQEKRDPGKDRHVAEGVLLAAASCRHHPPCGDGEQVRK